MCGIATSQLKSLTNYSRNRYTFCVQRDRVTDPSVVLFGGVPGDLKSSVGQNEILYRIGINGWFEW